MTASASGRLSLLYACLFFELGVNLPFFPIWLQAQSLGSDAIGIILAVPLLTRILANPMVGALADQSGQIARALLVCAILVAIGTGLLSVATGFWPILAVVVAIALAQGPLIALSDAMTLGHLAGKANPELIYGRIRLWGSIGFALANVIAGWLFEWFSAPSIVALLLIAAVLTAAAAARCVPVAVAQAEAKPFGEASPIAPFLLLGTIVGAALVQASHAAFYGFGTLHWQASGVSGAAMGGLWALGILSEIVVFAVIGHRMRGPASAAGLLVVAAVVAMLRWSCMAWDLGVATLGLLQLMNGITFGVTHLASIFLLAWLAPGRMQARAQAWLAGAWAGVMAVLTALCGSLYDSWGEQIYLVMVMVAGIGSVPLLLVAVGLRQVAMRKSLGSP